MVDEIEHLILCDHYALGIFLDFKGAFDNLNIESSIRGMLNKGLYPHISRWYSYYLQHWSVETKIKGITATRTIMWGTPQRRILSPIGWNVAFDKLLDDFNTGPAQIKGFADDAVVVIWGPDVYTLIE